MKRTPAVDRGLAQIAAFSAAIVAAYDERQQFNPVPAEDAARQRLNVEQLAATIGERLRADYLSRSRQA